MADSGIKAAIDVGTNSMHLVVARFADRGGFELLTTEKEMVRLGSGGGEMKRLADDAIERGIVALHRMKAVAGSFGEVEIAAVATSAVREAANRQEFLERALHEVGIEIEVISGFEEARLIYLGVLQALPVFDQRVLAIDIGGGSTELCVGRGDRIIEARSMKLGAIRLTERFFGSITSADHDGSVEAEAVDACRGYVRSALAPVVHEFAGHHPEVTVGSSGTASTLAEMALARRDEKPQQINGAVFAADELTSIVDDLTSATTVERLSMSRLDEKRVDIIVAGAILLDEIFRAFAIERMTISEQALREGVLFDRFAPEAVAELSDLRRTNLLRLADQLDPDPAHARHTALLATELFDRLEPVHGLGTDARELLDAAALVHNVGLFISHSSHHKHSYYVIRNSEQLTGFSDREIELVAVVARYHRKSLPKSKHEPFDALGKRDQRLVRILAGCLRIAIGLDRRHAGSVRSVRVTGEHDRICIEPVAETDADIALEVYAARERTELLALGLDLDVLVSDPAGRD